MTVQGFLRPTAGPGWVRVDYVAANFVHPATGHRIERRRDDRAAEHFKVCFSGAEVARLAAWLGTPMAAVS